MLIVTAIISIEMKPESVAEFEFPTRSGWQTVLRKHRDKIDPEIFR